MSDLSFILILKLTITWLIVIIRGGKGKCKDAGGRIDAEASAVTFEKGYHPIRMGDEVNSFYFIVSGVVRGYYIDDGGERRQSVLARRTVSLAPSVSEPVHALPFM